MMAQYNFSLFIQLNLWNSASCNYYGPLLHIYLSIFLALKPGEIRLFEIVTFKKVASVKIVAMFSFWISFFFSKWS